MREVGAIELPEESRQVALGDGLAIVATVRGIYLVDISTCTPCLADIDQSGSLDLFDFLEFQRLFAERDVRADFDADRELTVFDFLAFQNAFASGC
ncbi:MAG: GC-type dockerin domain-anchored protein [Phycisphaerales bacterium JB064]